MAEKIKKETKEKGLSTQVDADILAELQESYPTEPTFNRVLLPRLSMASQDVTEEVKNAKTGKKEIKIIIEAGTFATEVPTDEEDEAGKKIWERNELGDEIEAIILFERKQLKYYDTSTKLYTSSPVYDTDDQILPLFLDKNKVDRGTPIELQSREEYQGLSAKGKPISKLEINRILYVLYEGEIYQMNIRGTSMYAFMTYKKKRTPNMVLTRMNSEPKEAGTTKWNQMTFEQIRPIDAEEAQIVVTHLRDIKKGIEDEKAFFATKGDSTKKTPANKQLGKGKGESDETEGEDW